MFRFVFLLAALLSTPVMAELDYLPNKEQVQKFYETDSQLISLYEMSNTYCRGGLPDTLDMYKNCALRELYSDILQKRGYCNNEYDENGPTDGPAYIKCPSK
ncbi:hypothetical protein [Cohaesibacter marisflavi]|uniref:hypothetical protein n=1 Tax=Cohaesibacter marisflavi TaxID=655353 RepID=UPI0029C617C1|nr:hypothetical protein [Cohaesibacter marisflavi]